MELKKNPQADVHQKKSTNLLIGLNAALILILVLFYINNPPEVKEQKKKSFSNEEIELIPPTEQEPPKAPPPPPSPEIQEVEDEADVEETEIQSNEADEKKVVITTPLPTGDGGEEKIEIDNTVYTDVDVEGTFPGGEEKLTQFVQNFFKMPSAAQELGISGIVFIQFVVERDGTISNIKAIAPPERQLGYGLEKECMRVIQLTSGKWKPAERAGKKVRSYWRFPFEIDNSGF